MENSGFNLSIKNKDELRTPLVFCHLRSSHGRCSIKKAVLRSIALFTRKTPVLESLFNNVPGLNPVDTGRKLNVHKTFRRRPGRLLNVLCTFNYVLYLQGRPATSLKTIPTQVFSFESREIFKTNYFEEHVRMAVFVTQLYISKRT